jgi:hypothetical protein
MDANPENPNTAPETVADQPAKFSVGPKFRIALALAIVADAIQFFFIPFFVEGAESPIADAVDVVMAAAMYFLLGWHWEFLPSFAIKLIPGVDLVPLWTLAVANVYRKSRSSMVKPGTVDPAV